MAIKVKHLRNGGIAAFILIMLAWAFRTSMYATSLSEENASITSRLTTATRDAEVLREDLRTARNTGASAEARATACEKVARDTKVQLESALERQQELSKSEKDEKERNEDLSVRLRKAEERVDKCEGELTNEKKRCDELSKLELLRDDIEEARSLLSAEQARSDRLLTELDNEKRVGKTREKKQQCDAVREDARLLANRVRELNTKLELALEENIALRQSVSALLDEESAGSKEGSALERGSVSRGDRHPNAHQIEDEDEESSGVDVVQHEIPAQASQHDEHHEAARERDTEDANREAAWSDIGGDVDIDASKEESETKPSDADDDYDDTLVKHREKQAEAFAERGVDESVEDKSESPRVRRSPPAARDAQDTDWDEAARHWSDKAKDSADVDKYHSVKHESKVEFSDEQVDESEEDKELSGSLLAHQQDSEDMSNTRTEMEKEGELSVDDLKHADGALDSEDSYYEDDVSAGDEYSDITEEEYDDDESIADTHDGARRDQDDESGQSDEIVESDEDSEAVDDDLSEGEYEEYSESKEEVDFVAEKEHYANKGEDNLEQRRRAVEDATNRVKERVEARKASADMRVEDSESAREQQRAGKHRVSDHDDDTVSEDEHIRRHQVADEAVSLNDRVARPASKHHAVDDSHDDDENDDDNNEPFVDKNTAPAVARKASSPPRAKAKAAHAKKENSNGSF